MLDSGDVAELEDAVNNATNRRLIAQQRNQPKLIAPKMVMAITKTAANIGFTRRPCAGSNPAITIERCLQQSCAYDS